jgi:hypothetical protein
MVNVDHEAEQSERTSEEKPSGTDSTMQEAAENNNTAAVASSSSTGPNTSATEEAKTGQPLNDVLQSLPHSELRLLCSLLAREGYAFLLKLLYKYISLTFWLFPPVPSILSNNST